MTDSRSTGRRPVLARDVRAWVEELERLLRDREQGILAEGEATEARHRELVSRLRGHWNPGVGDGLAGAELVRPAGYGDFASTWHARRPSSKAPVLVSAFDPRAFDQGFLLLSFLDGMEAMETLGRYGTGSPHVSQVLQVDESMLAWSFEQPVRGSLGEGPTRGWSLRRKIGVVIEIARALAYGHAQGVVHGGLRLESVGLADDGRAVVHEFGLHRRPVDRLEPDQDPLRPYLAPELLAGSLPDARSDVFALGRLAAAILLDLTPGAGLSRLDVLDLDALPADVAPILRRATQTDPNLRQASAQELLFELESGQVKAPLLSTSAALDFEQVVPVALRRRLGVAVLGLLAVALAFLLVPDCERDADPVAVDEPAGTPEPPPVEAPAATPDPAPRDPRSSEALAGGFARFLPDEDAPDPYAHIEDPALRARLHFLDEAVELRGAISGRVDESWAEQDDAALLALMAWTLERRGLDPERVQAIRAKLGQERHQTAVGGVPFELAKVPGPLWIATREVNQALWAAVLGDRPSFYVGDDLPVERVTWCRALEFCNALSVLAGVEPIYAGVEDCAASDGRSVQQTRTEGGFRLPSAAEWQAAASAGVPGRSIWVGEGREAVLRVGWLKDNGDNKTHPVGSLAENPAGLADVHGNVAEWIWEPAPKEAEVTRFVSVRGGSWRFGERYARVAERTPKRPGDAESDIGLRPVWQGAPPVFPEPVPE